MRYRQTVVLKNGEKCLIRHVSSKDVDEVCRSFLQTHSETDYTLTYPDEAQFVPERERAYFVDRMKSRSEVELCAVVGGKIVGTAGVESIGNKYKVAHRAEFGISVEKAYWGLGIGKALTKACISCAKKGGFAQLELDVVADNIRALSLYQALGFTEYGRNPKGFLSRIHNRYQELILMRLDLEKENIQ